MSTLSKGHETVISTLTTPKGSQLSENKTNSQEMSKVELKTNKNAPQKSNLSLSGDIKEIQMKHKQAVNKIMHKNKEVQRLRNLKQAQQNAALQVEKQREVYEEATRSQQSLKKKQQRLQKLQVQRQERQRAQSQLESTNQTLKEVLKRPLLYENLARKFGEQKEEQIRQEKDAREQQVKKLYSQYTLEKINLHELTYVKKKESSNSKNVKVNHSLPKVYRSERLLKLHEEELTEANVKEDRIKQRATQRVARHKEYIQYLRARGPPPQKDASKLNHSILKLKPDERLARLKGLQYLEQAKKLKRKPKQQSSTQLDDFGAQDQFLELRPSQKGSPNISQHMPSDRVNKIVSCGRFTKDQKIRELSLQTIRLDNEAEKRMSLSRIVKDDISQDLAVECMLKGLKARAHMLALASQKE